MNMIQSAKDQVLALTTAAYQKASAAGLLPEGVTVTPSVEIPKDTANGDYTTTFCLAAAKAMKMNPRQVAQILTEQMDLTDTYFTSVELAGGFGTRYVFVHGLWYPAGPDGRHPRPGSVGTKHKPAPPRSSGFGGGKRGGGFGGGGFGGGSSHCACASSCACACACACAGGGRAGCSAKNLYGAVKLSEELTENL